MWNRLLILCLLFCTIGCSKDNVGGKDVEIYLLDFGTLVAGACKVDEATARLASAPLVRSSDIQTYSASEYRFTLTEAGYTAVKNLGDKVLFAVTVDAEVVYYGVVKPGYSSSSCDASITMNTIGPGNSIQMNLGYPGTVAGVVIEDKRNDPRLLATLRNLGKLVP